MNPFLENHTKAMYYLKMKYENRKVKILLLGSFVDASGHFHLQSYADKLLRFLDVIGKQLFTLPPPPWSSGFICISK